MTNRDKGMQTITASPKTFVVRVFFYEVGRNKRSSKIPCGLHRTFLQDHCGRTPNRFCCCFKVTCGRGSQGFLESHPRIFGKWWSFVFWERCKLTEKESDFLTDCKVSCWLQVREQHLPRKVDKVVESHTLEEKKREKRKSEVPG